MDGNGRQIARALRCVSVGLAASVLLVAPGLAQNRASPDVRLVLNVPESRLYLYENGKAIEKYRVAIGMEGHETPHGAFRVTHAIWNPWWHPPDSEWARDRSVEPPGSPTNPMGRIKLHFAELLYIHGTPEEETLGRMVSRGCVRMSNAELIELTRYLHGHFAPHVPATLIDRLIANPRQTRQVNFRRAIPFEVIYRVAEVREGQLFIFPDVYGQVGSRLEEHVTATLLENGVDPASVDREKLDRLLRKGVDRRVAMPLAVLTAPASSDAEPMR
jgi:murein L,D-transpeptidase YcbB/YkuD